MAKNVNRKSKKRNSPKKPSSEFWLKVKTFLKSDDWVKIRAVFDIVMAAFLFVAILSFFLTDQFASPTEYGENWLGWLGGWLSNLLVSRTFGLAAVGFSLILLSLGLERFRKVKKFQTYDEGKVPDRKKKILLPWMPTLFFTLFWMAWVSCAFGYINHCITHGDEAGALENFAGSFGFITIEFLVSIIKLSTPILLLILAGVVLYFGHHVKLPALKLRAKTAEEDIEEEEPEEEEAEGIEEAPKPNLLARLFKREPKEEAVEPTEQAKEKDDEGADYEPNSLLEDMIAEEKASKEAESQEEESQTKPIEFDIDDEFERVNARARAKQNAGDGPIFNVVDPAGNIAGSDEHQEEPAENPHPAIQDEIAEERLAEMEEMEKKEREHYTMPSTDFLEDWERKNTKVTQEELIANKDRIVETLRNYGIEIVEILASPGPTVTLYEIKPAPGIRISKIKSLEDDIALSLAALGIRIIAPIPGKGAVGIEVPNAHPKIVSMKTMLSADVFKNNTKMELPVVLGKTISNEPYVADLAKMPHLLMAGATGTGKSVGLNAIIASLLYKKRPWELKFVMVDPKKVELSLYSKIERQYLAKMPDTNDGEAIITDVKKVVRTLNSLCMEMDQRYDLLKSAGVKKITEYNERLGKGMLDKEAGHHFLPYIVLVIDEFADLIMTAGKEVEHPICRLAQLARAVGIHLIIATQRPTTNIITGTIKTNFPARIAFRVTSAIDSRTILDTGGANQLIGRGDMLISLAGSDMVRLQCALIETEEIEKLAEHIGAQSGFPDGSILPEYLDENEEPNKDFDPHQKDPLFNDAARMVVASQFGSTSLLQRKMQLGYNRAGRIMDQLEGAGIVGSYNGSKPREVLIKDPVELEELLNRL